MAANMLFYPAVETSLSGAHGRNLPADCGIRGPASLT
jgi:hypothetical protein